MIHDSIFFFHQYPDFASYVPWALGLGLAMESYEGIISAFLTWWDLGIALIDVAFCGRLVEMKLEVRWMRAALGLRGPAVAPFTGSLVGFRELGFGRGWKGGRRVDYIESRCFLVFKAFFLLREDDDVGCCGAFVCGRFAAIFLFLFLF